MSTKVTDLTALSGSGVADTDTFYIVDGTVSKKITAVELFSAWPAAVTTELAGSAVASTDEFLVSDAGVAKTITAVELFNSFPAAVTTELLGTNAVSTDELLISDAGVAKTITLAQFISAIAKLGFTLADIPAYADQAAAATALTGTGQLFRFNTTGALGITIT
jgi:hypothetical protein